MNRDALVKAKILIVDDEKANILLLQKIFEVNGYKNIISTLEPEHVLPLHEENNFNLILMDINMPQMSGYFVLEKLKNESKSIMPSVVAISGNVSTSDILRAKESGFTDYITKPIKIKRLLHVVENILL